MKRDAFWESGWRPWRSIVKAWKLHTLLHVAWWQVEFHQRQHQESRWYLCALSNQTPSLLERTWPLQPWPRPNYSASRNRPPPFPIVGHRTNNRRSQAYEWENTQARPRRCRGNQNWRGYPHFSTAWTNSTDLENRGEGKGHSRECKNYREISLCSSTGKITMKIIRLRLQKHCEQ